MREDGLCGVVSNGPLCHLNATLKRTSVPGIWTEIRSVSSSPNVSKQAPEESIPCLSAPVTEISLFQSKISLCSLSKSKLCSTAGLLPVELFCSWLMSCSALRRELGMRREALPVSLSSVPLPITKCLFITLMSEYAGFLHVQRKYEWFLYNTCQHDARVCWERILGRWYVVKFSIFILFYFISNIFWKVGIYVGWS